MAFDQNHYVLRFGGSAHLVEMWSSGLRFAGTGLWLGTLPEMHIVAVTQLANVQAAVETMWAHAGGLGVLNHNLDWITFNPVGTDGHQDATLDTVRWDDTTPTTGDNPEAPPQVAIVASLRTAATRGKAHAGRMYMPGIMGTMNADGSMPLAIVNQVGNKISAMLTSINGIGSGGGTAFVASTFSSMGGHRPITSVRVGDVYDTQRRRRNQLVEGYAAYAV